jgi:hypothetical protein
VHPGHKLTGPKEEEEEEDPNFPQAHLTKIPEITHEQHAEMLQR